MPIDPSIPLQAKGVQLESPVNQLTMMNEALKYGEMNRAIGEQNQLNEYLKSGADLASAEGKRGLLNYGKTGIAHAKAIGDIEKSGLETKKLQNDTKLQGLEFAYQGARNMVANPTNENIIAWGQDSVMNGYASADHVNSQVKQILAMPVDQRRAYLGSLGAKAKDMIDQYMISKSQQADLNIKQGNLAVNQQTLANANNPALQESLAAAKASGTTKGKAIATTQLNLPNAIATSEDLVNKIDAMVGKEAKIDKATNKVLEAGTVPHKGFTGAVGMGSWKAAGIPGVQQYVPGSAAADFKSRYDEIMGGAFLEAFETLKGGGSITETEGKKATAAKTRMSLAQSEGEFMSAAREYQGFVRRGIERAKAKAASGGAAPAGGEIDFNNLN